MSALEPTTRLLCATVVVLALLAACGGSAATSGSEPAAHEATAAVPPPDLAFVGALGSGAPEVSSVVVDSTGGSSDIGSATLTVPPDALAGPTRIGSTVVELDFGDVSEPPFGGTIYSLATVDDVPLGEPVVLEIPKPADSVIVNQRVDGEWSTVEVPPGASTRVRIEHFSEVTTTVIDRPASGTAASVPPEDASVPAVYLEACLLMFTDRDDHEVVAQLGYSICTQSLIDTLTPFDAPKVPAACVGEKIGPAVDIRAAIAQCVEEASDRPGESIAEPSAEVQDETDDRVAPDDAAFLVKFSGTSVQDGATFTADWRATVQDGYGEGVGRLDLDGPCTDGDGELLLDFVATFEYPVEVAGDTSLAVVVGPGSLTSYSQQLAEGFEGTCEDVLATQAVDFLTLIESDAEAAVELGCRPYTMGVVAGEVCIELAE